MNKVLITGGAGYLGSTLAEHLLNNNYEVTVLDNLMYDQISLLHLFKRDGFKFELGDVRNTILLQKLVMENDVIIPLAAIVGMPCKANPE
jgi:nucleoside-diphosphate-sugar epimerase